MPIRSFMRRPSTCKNLKALRRTCEIRLATLNLSGYSSVFDLGADLSYLRGRPLRFVAMSMEAPQPCGLWVATHAQDFIIYETCTSRPHQHHIIAHELAHMICCHRRVRALDDNGAQLLFPDLDPRLVHDMLQRSSYSEPEEQEAEMLASLILQRSLRRSGGRVQDLSSKSPETIRRITRTIGNASEGASEGDTGTSTGDAK
jgi:hypothetical protein